MKDIRVKRDAVRPKEEKVRKLNEMKERFEQNIGDGIFEKQVLSALSECEDIMPRGMCANLDVPQGSTYKQGVASILNVKSNVEHLLEADRVAGLE